MDRQTKWSQTNKLPDKVITTETIITEAIIESNSPFEKEDATPNDLLIAPFGRTEDC
jgi:hypothetical protein